MAFALKPFREIIKASKEVIDDLLAPVRVRSVRLKAELKATELEEKMIGLERQINELCTEKDPNLDKIVDLIDRYELAERRHLQIRKLVGELFPEE